MLWLSHPTRVQASAILQWKLHSFPPFNLHSFLILKFSPYYNLKRVLFIYWKYFIKKPISQLSINYLCKFIFDICNFIFKFWVMQNLHSQWLIFFIKIRRERTHPVFWSLYHTNFSGESSLDFAIYTFRLVESYKSYANHSV